MAGEADEWFRQVDFDVTVDMNMAESRSYPYAVFICHLVFLRSEGIMRKKLQSEKIHSWFCRNS